MSYLCCFFVGKVREVDTVHGVVSTMDMDHTSSFSSFLICTYILEKDDYG